MRTRNDDNLSKMPWPVGGRTPLGFLRSRSPVKMRQLRVVRQRASQNRPLYGLNDHRREAPMKLNLPSFFVEQVLRNEPVPDHVLDKIERNVGPMQHSLFQMAGLPGSPAHQRGVYPSRVRDFRNGSRFLNPLNVSSIVRQKMAQLCAHRIMSERTQPPLWQARSEKLLGQMWVCVIWLHNGGGTETSLRKLYEGEPVSRGLTKKVEAALACARPTDRAAGPSVAIERLQRIHKLYKELGTLEAVGKHVGLTHERVQTITRQRKGHRLIRV